MDKCLIISPTYDLVTEVADLLEDKGNDFSGNLVVFPGKRPSHFLRKCIAERHRSAFIPPVVLSMEEFVDRMYEAMYRPRDRKLEPIDAVAFLFELHRGMERPIGGEAFLSLETFFSLGVRIFRDLEELTIENVDGRRFSEMESLVDKQLPPEITRSLQSLSYFYDSFYPALKRAGLSSRSERYRFVSSSLRKDEAWGRIIFAGFYGLTAAEKLIFRKLEEWDETVFLFQDGPGIDEQIGFLQSKPARKKPGDGRPDEGRPSIYFHKSPDAHGQVFALSALLKDQISDLEEKGVAAGELKNAAKGLGETAIILPSAGTLFPVLYHAVPGICEDDYNVSLGYPLERTPTWGFLGSLIQLCQSMDGDRLYVPDYLDFVLHPYTKNIYLEGKSELTRIIFHAIEEVLLKDARNFISLEEIEDNEEVFALIESRMNRAEAGFSLEEIRIHLRGIHDELIRAMDHFEDIGDFAQKIITVLNYMYDRSSARLHPFFHPFAEAFIGHLDLLKFSRLKGLGFSERRGYFHFLKRYISRCFTPFEGTPLHGLQILGFLETRNLRFERTYLLDVNEDVIPDTKKEETLIPLSLRKALGLPTYRQRDMLSAYYFDTLVRGSTEVHLFYVEDGRKEKSRFVERLLWERQQREGGLNRVAYESTLNYRLSLQGNEPSSVRKTPRVVDFLRSCSVDATSLDSYLRCPLQFYYRYVLNMRRKEDGRLDVERVDIGKLVHRVLLGYFENRIGQPLTPADVDVDEMKRLIHALFRDSYGSELVGTIFLLREQIVRQMLAYLQYYELPLLMERPVTVLHLEHRIRRNIDGILFQGIIDRIDRRDGKMCVIDYKTGSSSKRYAIAFDRLDVAQRQSWGDAIGSIQLPFYLFLNEEGPASGKDWEAMFLFLGKTRVDGSIEVPLFKKEDDRGSAYRMAKEVILRLVQEIRDPLVDFDPAVRKKDACIYCDYQDMCGTKS